MNDLTRKVVGRGSKESEKVMNGINKQVGTAKALLSGKTANKNSAYLNKITISPEEYKGKWMIFFSYPASFTPVCTTGFMTFACMQPELEKLRFDCVKATCNGGLNEAQRILYLADNAGEIAFDRLLIEQIGPARVTVAVRGGPVINDATITDARAVGLHEIVEIIENGSDAPGTLLDDCSQEFKWRFAEADLILAKGQGNFEALSDEPHNIFFLLKAKCAVIAAHAGVPLGTHVLVRSEARIRGLGGVS